jgi:hypothetical protein
VPRSLAELQQELKHLDWKVRAQAADTLGEQRDAKATTALLEALNDESQFVRLAAVRSLGRLGDPKTIPGLIASLSDPAFTVRLNALWSLGEIGDPSAIPAIQPYTTDQTLFPERAITVGKLAEIAIARIEAKEEASKAAAAATDAQVEAAGDTGTPAREGAALTPEERKAKREAALARKRGAEGGASEGAPAGAVNEAAIAPTPTPATTAATPAAGEEADERPLTPEERKAKREAALARKRAQQKGEGG